MPRIPQNNKKNGHLVDEIIGKKIKTQRLLKGWSQITLGKSVGITFQQIQKYEQGTNRVTISRLHDISDALNVPLSFFLDSLSGSQKAEESPEYQPLSKEAAKLIQFFSQIQNPALRKQILSLTKNLASTSGIQDTFAVVDLNPRLRKK
jgi:transcriptional regulator with XRE-family HTH domain